MLPRRQHGPALPSCACQVEREEAGEDVVIAQLVRSVGGIPDGDARWYRHELSLMWVEPLSREYIPVYTYLPAAKTVRGFGHAASASCIGLRIVPAIRRLDLRFDTGVLGKQVEQITPTQQLNRLSFREIE